MEIYVVQQGDNVNTVASQYGISPERLITDNGISPPYSLAVGQTLVITEPSMEYTVMNGDTLEGIAEAFQVTVMQLLRNNPKLADRQYLYPGETLVIRYDNTQGNLMIAGYAFPYINDVILRMTLPYLTYLVIFNYRVTPDGDLVGSDEDIAVIETAKEYGVKCTLLVTVFSGTGEADLPTAYEILLNPQLQDTIIDNILSILNEKNYTGVNMSFQLIDKSNQQLFLDYLTNVADTLHPFGYYVYVTLNPGISFNGTELTFESLDYAAFAGIADGLLFLSFNWGYIEKPP